MFRNEDMENLKAAKNNIDAKLTQLDSLFISYGKEEIQDDALLQFEINHYTEPHDFIEHTRGILAITCNYLKAAVFIPKESAHPTFFEKFQNKYKEQSKQSVIQKDLPEYLQRLLGHVRCFEGVISGNQNIEQSSKDLCTTLIKQLTELEKILVEINQNVSNKIFDEKKDVEQSNLSTATFC